MQCRLVSAPQKVELGTEVCDHVHERQQRPLGAARRAQQEQHRITTRLRASEKLRKEVCRRLVGESFAEAQTICRQGEIGEKFYVIVRGSVSVQVEGAGEVAVLEPYLWRGVEIGNVELKRLGPALVARRFPSGWMV